MTPSMPLSPATPPWPLRQRRELSLTSVRASDQTAVHLLGQAEDEATAEQAAVEWRQEDEGLHISATRNQRLYNNRRWPNPVVIKITHAQLGLVPPTVITGEAAWESASSSCLLSANLADLGAGETVEVGFEYRLRKRLTESIDQWQESPFETVHSTGSVTRRLSLL